MLQRMVKLGRRPYSSLNTPELGPTEDPEYQKGVFWLENIFPFKFGVFDPRQSYINSLARQYQDEFKINELIPKQWPTGSSFKTIKTEPNLKEGGLYLEFKYKGGTTVEALEHIRNHLKANNAISYFNLGPINIFQVSGRPWVEDLLSRKPSRRLHVEFYGPDLTVEDLYREFRVFGRIVDITLQKSSDKEVPRYASVQFLRKRAATSARNCIHGEQFLNTKIAIGYEVNQGWWFKIWQIMISNPRIAVLLLLGLIAGISFSIFDPLRIWSITNNITGRYSISKSAFKWWNLLERLYFDSFTNVKINVDVNDLHKWTERDLQIKTLGSYLKQSPENIILVSGPKGSGKSGFVKKCLDNHPNTLVLNCSEMVGKGEYKMISNLSHQVNFFPTFGQLGQLTQIIDTMITAATGAKAGLASSNDSDIKKILECITIAVTRITESQVKNRKKQIKMAENNENMKISEIDYPIIVIDEFLGKESAKESFIYEILCNWAAVLSESRVAHVVFVSDRPSSILQINKAIPTKTPEVFHLSDASVEAALSYVNQRLGSCDIKEDLLPFVSSLGGRFYDLDIFVSKIQSGLSPSLAFEDMIHRAVTDLRKTGNLDDSGSTKTGWTNVQFWKIIALLAKKPEIQFDELASHAIFSSDTTPILAMERAGIINFNQKNERPYSVIPNRPLYTIAFQKMVDDLKLSSFMGVMSSKKLMSDYSKKIQEYEQELEILNRVELDRNGTVNRGLFHTDPLSKRRNWLIKSIGEYQIKIEREEVDSDRMKKNLKLQ